MTGVEQLNIPVSILTETKSMQSSMAYGRTVVTLFTKEGLNASKKWARGEEAEVDQEGINSHFYDTVKKLNKLPEDATRREVERHWGEALNLAYHLVEYAATTAIPASFNFPEQRAEVYDRAPSPYKLLKTMSSDPEDDLRFETRRQIALALIIGDFIAFKDNASLRDRNEEIHKLFKEELFTSGPAYPLHRYLNTDPLDNRFLGFAESPAPSEAWMDVQEFRKRARLIDLDDKGTVLGHYSPRIKSPVRSAIKALIESASKGGKIRTLTVVGDNVGSKIVVDQDETTGNKVDAVMDKATEALKAKYPNIRVEPRDNTRKNRGQSVQIEQNWRRARFHFPEFPGSPYELIARSVEAEYNADHAIGPNDPETGLPTEAHQLYEVNNIAKVIDLLFPQDRYPDINFKVALRSQALAITDQLRRSNIVHTGDIKTRMAMIEAEKQAQTDKITETMVLNAGADLITQNPKTNDEIHYRITGMADSGQIILRRSNGTEFFADPHKMAKSGKLGKELIVGTREGQRDIFDEVEAVLSSS